LSCVSPTRACQLDGVPRQLRKVDDRDFGVRADPGELLDPPDRSRSVLGSLLDLAERLQQARRVDLATLDFESG
jgi:hypothetical protein